MPRAQLLTILLALLWVAPQALANALYLASVTIDVDVDAPAGILFSIQSTSSGDAMEIGTRERTSHTEMTLDSLVATLFLHLGLVPLEQEARLS
jgi:hypothetical protein